MPRTQIAVKGPVSASAEVEMHGITDLAVIAGGQAKTLVSVTRGGGSLVRYQIDPITGRAVYADHLELDLSWLQLEATDLVPYARGGENGLWLIGLNGAQLQNLRVEAAAFSPREVHGVAANALSELAIFQEGASEDAIAALRGGGLAQVMLDSQGNLQVSPIDLAPPLQQARVSDLITAQVGAAHYGIAGWLREDTIAVFQKQADGSLSQVSSVTANADLFAASKVQALAAVQVAGHSYVLAAASGSGSLTVFRLNPDGQLQAVDHILDNQKTRFADVRFLDVVHLNGQNFVLAAGNDAGLSLLTVLPDGRLHHLESFAATAEVPLHGISSVEMVAHDGGLKIWVATESAPFLAEFDVSLSAVLAPRLAHVGSGLLSGTTGDDILSGLNGDDRIEGGRGDDILLDGAGIDTLLGGLGEDVFIFIDDDGVDRVDDFDPLQDQLDLTGLGAHWSYDALVMIQRDWGVELRFADQQIELRGAGAGRLMVSELSEANFVSTDRVSGVVLNPRAQIASFTGTDRRERLFGGDTHDVLSGLGGRDSLYGGAGMDSLYGGTGDDWLYGELGDDWAFGDSGDDSVKGYGLTYRSDVADGADTLDGGAGADRLYGGTDNDSLTGGDGNDRLYGQHGNDTLRGEDGNDLQYGHYGDDLLIGGDGDDHIRGGSRRISSRVDDGLDTLDGGAGADSLYGGTNDDSLYGGTGDDRLYGERGDDGVYGGDGNDTVKGYGLRYRSDVADGADTLDGGAGDDRLYGGADNDSLIGGDGNDRLYGQHGNDTLRGENGDDAQYGHYGDDLLIGGEGDDTLKGYGVRYRSDVADGADTLDGGAGDDRLYGGRGDDSLIGGLDDDYLSGRHGDDALMGDAGFDTLVGGRGDDLLIGSEGDDRLYGGGLTHKAEVNDGADRLDGGDGNDSLWGGTGDDHLLGGAGDDSMRGQHGDDILEGHAGMDPLIGGAGDDILAGERGADTFIFADGHGNDIVRGFALGSSLEKLDLQDVSGLADIIDVLGVEGVGGAARQLGDDVLIDTGADSSILLLGINLLYLDESDFIF